jgi:hypothetical protein
MSKEYVSLKVRPGDAWTAMSAAPGTTSAVPHRPGFVHRAGLRLDDVDQFTLSDV